MVSATTEIRLSPVREISGWQEFLRDGNGYLKTAVGGYKRRRDIFSAEILYNIIAMAIEKFIMAALMRHGALPFNHTMADLVEAMDTTFPEVMDSMRKGLLALDKYQEICSLDFYSICPPPMKEIPAMLELADKLQILVVSRLLPGQRTLQTVK